MWLGRPNERCYRPGGAQPGKSEGLKVRRGAGQAIMEPNKLGTIPSSLEPA